MPKKVATQEDWINLGFQLFSDQGVSGIIVEKMAHKLNVNKSSFYWYFKTKKDFIQVLIEHWVTIETDQIILLTNSENTAIGKFETLVKEAYFQRPFIDFIFYLKRFALKEQEIQQTIDRIDNQRIAFVTQLLTEIGYSELDATIKSSLFYKHLIGYHEMIRYKKQDKDYPDTVKTELNQFITY